MKNHVTYDENKLAHQEPVIAISQWQEFNDCDGSDAMAAAEEEEAWGDWRTRFQEAADRLGEVEYKGTPPHIP